VDPQQFKEAQRKSWYSAAPGWQECWKTFESGVQTVSDRLVELAKVNPNSRVLDIATGIGETFVPLANTKRANSGC
jgi:ubiquinone/menaquinone biosynthesis C-methylase UbiE